jgi:hypothetical protein
MEPNDTIPPLRRTQSAQAARPPTLHDPIVRNSPPLRAPPRLMLVNGKGEVSKMPSPIVDRMSDDDTSSSSETETPIQEHMGHVQSLSVPSLFDSPVKPNFARRDYSPTRVPGSPPKRTLSPPKMIVGTNEGKPRPVLAPFAEMKLTGRIIEEDIIINIHCHINCSFHLQNDHHCLSQLICPSQHLEKFCRMQSLLLNIRSHCCSIHWR